MKKNSRMLFKIVAILFCLFLLMLIIDKGREIKIPRPEGVYTKVQDVLILASALHKEFAQTDTYDKLNQLYIQDNESKIIYEDYLSVVEQIGTEQTPLFEEKYQNDFYLLQTDWQEAFEQLRGYYDTAGTISEIEVLLLEQGLPVLDSGGNPLAENQILAADGNVYTYQSDQFREIRYQKISALCQQGQLLTLLAVKENDSILKNIWLMERTGETIVYFWNGYEITVNGLSLSEEQEEIREQLADLNFMDGKLKRIDVKKDKISGKILSVGADQVTIEDQGTYSFAENMKVYRLYDQLKVCSVTDLTVGYGFTDFVLENGKICGALIARKEAMEYIRVAIRTNDFAGLVHETVTLTADTDFTMTIGEYNNRQRIEYQAGEQVELQPDSAFLKAGRAVIAPKTQTGKISLLSVNRSQGVPAYRGSLEINKGEDGMTVINEVLLEEYLFSVVPSEMPASYPLEALKAQAICARTYAYRYLLHSGLGTIGAHVDDSVGYQVYNNISENSNTTKAVKETTGKMLYFDGGPAGTYYYSTSCGYGTTAAVWKNDSPEDTSYLQAASIGSGEALLPQEMEAEEAFKSFIGQVREEDYEKEEPWYRWSFEVKELKKEKIEENLKNRYNSNSNQVLTLEGDDFVSQPVKKVGKITDIYCAKRLPGGVMDELVIVTDKNTFKVISENAIRYVLNDGVTKVLRQDGSEVASPNLLPSAFMIIDTVKKNGSVVGYKLSGGGYGHGVGMSQNGARSMGQKGFNCEEILNCFYSTCEIKSVY